MFGVCIIPSRDQSKAQSHHSILNLAKVRKTKRHMFSSLPKWGQRFLGKSHWNFLEDNCFYWNAKYWKIGGHHWFLIYRSFAPDKTVLQVQVPRCVLDQQSLLATGLGRLLKKCIAAFQWNFPSSCTNFCLFLLVWRAMTQLTPRAGQPCGLLKSSFVFFNWLTAAMTL